MKDFKNINLQIRSNLRSFKNHFFIQPDRNEVWNIYLNSFPEEVRNEFNCNTCKSFLRQYSGIVEITDDFEIRTMFDGDFGDPIYNTVFKNLSNYIKTLDIIKSIGRYSIHECGVEVNHTIDKLANEPISWYHFHLEEFDFSDTKTFNVGLNEYTVFKNTLLEISEQSVIDVLDLINNDNLYRGDEYKNLLIKFLDYIKIFSDLSTATEFDLAIWRSILGYRNLCNIKNSVIGQLLIEYTETENLEASVRKYESMTAPENYNRPKAIVTKAQIKRAEEDITKLGYMDSLNRRLIKSNDLDVNNLLFINNKSKINSIFDNIENDIAVDPSKLRVQDITIDEFIEEIIPNSKHISALLEYKHDNNFVALTTELYKNSKNMFKWNNPFAWSYTNGVTDSIKDKVKKAGGVVDGELRISLSWNNYDDLDLHVVTDISRKIYYGHKNNGIGILDVDMNVSPQTRSAVENVIYQNADLIMEDQYYVIVNNYTQRELEDVGFTIEIECKGKLYTFTSSINPRNNGNIEVCKFKYDMVKGVYDIIKYNNISSDIIISEKWNVKSNVWTNVSHIMKSPNQWGDVKSGLEHTIFILEDCIPDEKITPFFNEYIKPDLLNNNKRAFEILNNKLRIDPLPETLSGVGFSKNNNKSLILKVDEKIYNVNF